LYSPYRKGEYKIRPYEINPTGRNNDQGRIFFIGNHLRTELTIHEDEIMAPQLVTRKSDFFRVWKKFVEKGVSDNVPETIRNSWLRSRNAGLNPLDICLTKTLIGPALQNELNSSIDFQASFILP